jgi:hypothetical protein
MKHTLKHAIAAAVLMLNLAAPVVAGPFEDAAAAHDRGDYATALRLLVASLLFPALAAAESLQMPKELQGTIAYKSASRP